jgi:putative ABC transport system ATP-binding protein
MLAHLNQVDKIYSTQASRTVALDKTTLTINERELVLILGPSGSGKSTLLSLLGCLIYPTSGSLHVDGQDVSILNQRSLASLRLRSIGFVFQNFNLFSPLTAEENVLIPLQLLKVGAIEAHKRALEALRLVGMEDKRRSLPKRLSGGEQQRIAIARALVSSPKMILCDEPTASLDKASLEIVMNKLKSLSISGKAVAVVTHDPRLRKYADRVIELKNGSIQTDSIEI